MQYRRKSMLYWTMKRLPERLTLWELRCNTRMSRAACYRLVTKIKNSPYYGVVGSVRGGNQWVLNREPLILFMLAFNRMRVMKTTQGIPNSREEAKILLDRLLKPVDKKKSLV